MTKAKRIILWVVTILLALLFIASGAGKLMGGAEVVEGFRRYGYPDWFRLLIGVAEVGGGLLLLIPRAALLAAVGLCVIMAGAVYTHIKAGEVLVAIVPLVIFILLVVIGYARRPQALKHG